MSSNDLRRTKFCLNLDELVDGIKITNKNLLFHIPAINSVNRCDADMQ